MIDLFGTVVMPATILYLIWILYLGITEGSQFVEISLILLAAVYGLQAIVFLVRRKWEHVGWMIIYILALPVFGFYIPLYSFWHFDDFSWGNTRLVVGDKGKKKFVAEEEDKFDPKSIPRKKWQEHEQEMWESNTTISSDTQKSRKVSRPPTVLSDFRPSSELRSSSVIRGGGGSFVMPSDEEILATVRKILDNADLMNITKKQVRDELTRIFGVDMTPRKEWINMCIEGILAGKL